MDAAPIETAMSPDGELQPILAGCALQRLKPVADGRGMLVSLEPDATVPFDIERVYYMAGMPAGSERGFHAHRALHQMLICVGGSCTIVVDNGRERAEVRLDTPDLALHVGPMIWREMKEFSEHCVLMVLASARYDEADYIRDYQEFRSMSAPA